MLNYYFGSFVPLRKPVSYAVESAFPSPFGWSRYQQYNKGGNIFSDIGNSVGSFFSDPIGYAGDRLSEIDKTVIQPVYREVIQPVGKTLEGVGKAIANDPITFVATVAAVATGNAWMVPIIQGVSTAAKGGDITDVVKSVAISAATTWVGGQIGDLVTSQMQTGFAGSYEILGQSIEKSTAAVIGNVAGYSTAGAIGAAAAGKNGDQILTAALANGVGAALPLVLGNIPGFESLAAGKVEGLPPDVSKAIANGIAGTAGSVVAAAVTGKDVGVAAAAGLITAGINGLVSTKNMVTDLFKQGGEAIGVNKLPTETQAIVANTMASVFSTALTGGKAGDVLQQSMLSVGSQALQKYITDGIKTGSALVNQYFTQSEQIKGEFESETDHLVRNVEIRNGIADQINGIAQEQSDLSYQYEQVDNELDAFLMKSQGYQQQYDQTYAAYQQYVNKANSLVGAVNTKGKTANELAGKVNSTSQQVNDVIASQKWHVDQYNAKLAAINPLLETYNNAVNQTATVATNRVYAAEHERSYLPPGTQVAYGANGRYAYATVGPEGYIDFNNDRFGDPIQGTFKYGYAITYGGYTSAELESIKNDITAKKSDAENYARVANDLGAQAAALKGTYDSLTEQYQSALADYNNAKKENDDWSGKAESTLTTVNQIASKLSETNTLINQKYSEIQNINTKITDLNTEYTQLDSQLDSYDEQIKTSETKITDLKTQYESVNEKLEEAATPLTQQINELTKKVTNDLVAELDPDFNADEYKQINGLGDGIDAATHWLSLGKDQGLYTNKASADASKYEAVYDLATAIAKERGYKSGFDVPDSEWKKLYGDIEAHYGNNIAAIKAATPTTLAWETGVPTSARVSEFDESKLAEIVASKGTYGAWNAPAGLKTPAGTKLATAEEYANGKATAIQTKDGDIAYIISDGSQTVKLRNNEGNIIDFVVGSNDNGEGVYLDENGTSMRITIYGSDGQPTDAGKLEKVDPMEQDPLAAMYTFNTMDPALLGDFSKPGERIVEGSKAIIAWAEEKAKTGEGSDVLAIASKAVGGFGEQFQSFAGLAAWAGTQPKDTDLYKLGQSLLDISKASTPADFEKRVEAFEAQYNNVTGVKKAWEFSKAVFNDPATFFVNTVVPEVAQEVIPMVLGFGVGKVATLGLSKAATSSRLVNWVKDWSGFGTDVVANAAESAGGNYNSTYDEGVKIAKAAHPEWSKQQIHEYANEKAIIQGSGAAMLSVISAGFGGEALAKTMLGPKASSDAVSSLTDWFTGIGTKLTDLGKNIIKETGAETLIEEVPAQILKDVLFLKDDPNRDVLGNVALAGAQSIFTTAGTVGTVGAAHSAAVSMAELAMISNTAFTDAIKATNGDATKLGNVLNQWIPTTTPQGADLRNTIVPAIFEQNPSWANNYGDAGSYSSALAGFGVTNPVAITETVNTRFNQDVITSDELAAQLYNQGLVGVTVKDVQSVIGSGTQTPDQINTAAQQYVDANMVDIGEFQAAASQEGYQYTQAELDNLVGRGVEADVIAKFVAEIDPKAVTTEEATQYFKDLGYTKADAAVIAEFVKSAPEAEMQAAVAAYVDPRQVTRKEAINFFAGIGYVPTEEEINQYVVQGPEVVQDNIKAQLAEYVDPRFVDANEVKDIFKSMGLDAPVSGTDLARLSGQYAESDLAAKAKEALPIVSANSIYALMSGNSVASEQVKKELLAKIKEYGDLGMSAAEANAAATQAVAAQLGTTQENLLTALGATESNLLLKLENVESTLSDKIELYRNEGLTQAQAQAKALEEMSGQLGTTKEDLLAQIGATETNLGAKLLESEAKTSQAIDLTKTQLTGEINKVADLVGKPAQDVTQADLDYIRSVVAGTAQGETNLGYDVNRDGKIDAADQTAIENQFAIQKNQNIQQQVDPATGQTVYVDTTTGQTVDYWEPAAGTPWAATGIYAELERQKAQAAATAKAQAAKAKTAQQQSQFGQLMGMLFQAPDVAGQQVAVKTPDPAKIGYIYDFSSIFANPSQASMMPSPYGPMNTVAPKQPQQAANQPLFQLASGFAEGGIVNSNDIQVGGSMDDLINILKGN